MKATAMTLRREVSGREDADSKALGVQEPRLCVEPAMGIRVGPFDETPTREFYGVSGGCSWWTR
jgi:hypothetical protein